ncbi:hypothetical protein U3516DRAFT_910890 [Neocallimastix sp. 'constans']
MNFSYSINNTLNKKEILTIDSTNPSIMELAELETNSLIYTNDDNWYSNTEDYLSKLSKINESWTSEEMTNLWINPQKRWSPSNMDEDINNFTETK